MSQLVIDSATDLSSFLTRMDSIEGDKLVQEHLNGDFFLRPKHLAEFKDFGREPKLFTEVSTKCHMLAGGYGNMNILSTTS